MNSFELIERRLQDALARQGHPMSKTKVFSIVRELTSKHPGMLQFVDEKEKKKVRTQDDFGNRKEISCLK